MRQPASLSDRAIAPLVLPRSARRKSSSMIGWRSRVDLQPLEDLAVLIDHGESVSVGLDAGVFTAFGGAAAPGGARQAFATGVLVVALSRHDGVEEIPECVGVLDRSNPHLPLEGPQRDLDRVAGGASVAAGESIGVLCPQLGGSVLARELLGVMLARRRDPGRDHQGRRRRPRRSTPATSTGRRPWRARRGSRSAGLGSSREGPRVLFAA